MDICLFQERCIKIIYHANIWSIVNKIWSSILQKWSGSNSHQIFGSFFTKQPYFWHSENEKWIFRATKMKIPSANLLAIPICTLLQNMRSVRKLLFETSNNIGHLAWKPWIFTLYSSFWEDFFKIFVIFQVCCFVWLLGHKLGCNAKVLHFFDFFWIV